MLLLSLLSILDVQALVLPQTHGSAEINSALHSASKRSFQASAICKAASTPTMKDLILREARCISTTSYVAGCTILISASLAKRFLRRVTNTCRKRSAPLCLSMDASNLIQAKNDVTIRKACDKGSFCVNVDRTVTDHEADPHDESVISMTEKDIACKSPQELRGKSSKDDKTLATSVEFEIAPDTKDFGYTWQVSCSKGTPSGDLDKSADMVVELYVDGKFIKRSTGTNWYVKQDVTGGISHVKALCLLRGPRAGIVYADTNIPAPN